MVPILAFVVLIVGAIVIARIAASNRGAVDEPPKVEASTIFGDLPEEQPPVPGQNRGGRARVQITDNAPAGLTDNTVWIDALHVIDEGAAVFAKAKQAKASGDHSEWNRLGNEAKDLYNRAIEMTAVWEEELMEKYGENDRQVRDIIKTRNKWLEVLRTLHKTTGRG
jgi:hypothetical protein